MTWQESYYGRGLILADREMVEQNSGKFMLRFILYTGAFIVLHFSGEIYTGQWYGLCVLTLAAINPYQQHLLESTFYELPQLEHFF